MSHVSDIVISYDTMDNLAVQNQSIVIYLYYVSFIHFLDMILRPDFGFRILDHFLDMIGCDLILMHFNGSFSGNRQMTSSFCRKITFLF